MIREQHRAATQWRLPWGARDVLLGFGAAILAFAVTVAVTVVLFAVLGLSRQGQIVLSLITNAGFEAAAAAIVVYIAVRRRGAGLSDLGFRPFPASRLWWVLGFFVLAYAILTAYFATVQGFGIEWLEPQQQVPEGTFDSAAAVAAAGVAVVLVAPVAEEVFFRGFVFGGLVSRLGPVGAAVISGALFSLVHGQLALVVPFTFIGALLAGMYYLSGSLWVAVLAHFAYNGLAFAVMSLVGAGV